MPLYYIYELAPVTVGGEQTDQAGRMEIFGTDLISRLSIENPARLFPALGTAPTIDQAVVVPVVGDPCSAVLCITGYSSAQPTTRRLPSRMTRTIHTMRRAEALALPPDGVILPWERRRNPAPFPALYERTASLYGAACGLIDRLLRLAVRWDDIAPIPRPLGGLDHRLDSPCFSTPLCQPQTAQGCLTRGLFTLGAVARAIPPTCTMKRTLHLLRTVLERLGGYTPVTDSDCMEAAWTFHQTIRYFYQADQIPAIAHYVASHPVYGRLSGVKRLARAAGLSVATLTSGLDAPWRMTDHAVQAVSAALGVPRSFLRSKDGRDLYHMAPAA